MYQPRKTHIFSISNSVEPFNQYNQLISSLKYNQVILISLSTSVKSGKFKVQGATSFISNYQQFELCGGVDMIIYPPPSPPQKKNDYDQGFFLSNICFWCIKETSQRGVSLQRNL